VSEGDDSKEVEERRAAERDMVLSSSLKRTQVIDHRLFPPNFRRDRENLDAPGITVTPMRAARLALQFRAMPISARIIDGKALANSIRADVAAKIKATQALNPTFHPQLAIVQAGERPDSSTYVRMKAKAAQEVGIEFRHLQLPADAAVDQIVQVVKQLNGDEQVNGILVQLPLGDHIGADGERLVTESVSPEKDVDG